MSQINEMIEETNWLILQSRRKYPVRQGIMYRATHTNSIPTPAKALLDVPNSSNSNVRPELTATCH